MVVGQEESTSKLQVDGLNRRVTILSHCKPLTGIPFDKSVERATNVSLDVSVSRTRSRATSSRLNAFRVRRRPKPEIPMHRTARTRIDLVRYVLLGYLPGAARGEREKHVESLSALFPNDGGGPPFG